MASRLVTPEDVLESLMNDGIIDGIRMKIIAQLKANEDMKKNTMMMVEQSKVLNTPGAEKKTKRELFDSLRRELETPVLEKASKAVWELMLDNNGLGKEITETVERVYCRLTGLELLPPPPPPPPPPPSSEGQQQEEKENGDKEEDEKAKEMDVSVSLSRKRSFGDMSMQGADAAANGSIKHFPVVPDDGGQKSSKPKT